MFILLFALGLCFGYYIFLIVTHPNHRKSIKHRLPKVKVAFVEISPNIKVNSIKHEIHLHHWLTLVVLAIFLHTHFNNGLVSNSFLNGFMVGGSLQGLTYPDKFKIIKKKA